MIPSVKEMLRIQKGPKIPESYERDSIAATKREMLRLSSSANTYEEIGRACVEVSKELDPFQMDDIIKARVFNRISHKCLLALVARVRDAKPAPKESFAQRFWKAMDVLRGTHG